MKKTAMNKMIDYLCTIGEYEIVSKANELLNDEKNQILDAYYAGGDEICPNGESGEYQSNMYYDTTFSTEANNHTKK